MKTLKTKSRPRSNSPYSSSANKLIKMSNMILPFKGLGSTELASFFDNVQVRAYPAGKMVFTPEDTACEQLYILRQGRVNLYRLTASGKRLLTAQILPGEVFGVRGMLGRTIQGNFAEAVEDSSIFIVTRKQLLAYLKSQPDLMLNLLETACYALYLLEERLIKAVYSPVSVRLAHFLLTNEDPASGLLNITHEDIGNTIGAVRQTVTEILSLMRKRGFLLTKPRQIQVIDRGGLEEFIRSQEDYNL